MPSLLLSVWMASCFDLRYSTEVQRALDVLDKQLEGKSYLCGEEYTIADMAWLPWVR